MQGFDLYAAAHYPQEGHCGKFRFLRSRVSRLRLNAGGRWYCLALSLLVCASAAGAPPTVRIGSKAFTESVILGEIAAQVIRHAGVGTIHKSQLGGTRTLWNALLAGDIDVYPEYTGTLAQEILKRARPSSNATLRAVLRRRGVYMSAPLGFDNTYAIGMRRARARQLGVRDISDLARHPALRFGFSNEFMARADGWPGLAARYALPQRDVRGLDHDLAYRGLV